MSFLALSSELTGLLPGLSSFLADTFINRAWSDIAGEKRWSFLETDGAVICPVQVTAGTVAFTQYQTTVTANAAASAALLALGSTPGLTSLQIRFGGQAGLGTTGQVYSIASVDSSDLAAIVLTLDRMIVEATNATSGYQCYRAYIKPPQDDFLAWKSLVDLTNGLSMTEENGRLSYSSVYFDLRDPQRGAQGLAYYLGAFKGDSELQPRPQYELWPHPTSGQTFYVRFSRRGLAFTEAADTQPLLIPDSLIMHRALGWYAYPWAAANVGHFPNLRGVGWVTLTLDAKKMYVDGLRDAKRNDDEQQLSTVWARGHGLVHGRGAVRGAFPIDANFMQSHLVNF